MKLNEAERDQLFKVWDGVWNRYERFGWSGLSEAEQAFYAAWHFESEVNSGGMESYYFNSGGDHALDAPHALRRVGAPQLAAILEEANGRFPGGLPSRDIDERQERMNALGDDVYTLWEDKTTKCMDVQSPRRSSSGHSTRATRKDKES